YAKEADTSLVRSLELFWALKEQEAPQADDVNEESAIEDESPTPEAESDRPPPAAPEMSVPKEAAAPSEAVSSTISRNEPGARATETVRSFFTKTYVANLGTDSALSSGLADRAPAVREAAMSAPPPNRPPQG